MRCTGREKARHMPFFRRENAACRADANDFSMQVDIQGTLPVYSRIDGGENMVLLPEQEHA